VIAYHRFRSLPEPTTEDAVELLTAWEFDRGEEVAVFLVRVATTWRHDKLPELEWVITLEDDIILHDWTVKGIIAAVVKLAERRGVSL